MATANLLYLASSTRAREADIITMVTGRRGCCWNGDMAHVGEDELAHVGEDALEKAGEDALEHAGGACALSFAASTLVATPSGERAISSLQVGDTVNAYDPTTGRPSTQTVEATYINHDTDLLDVTLRADTPTSASSAAAKDAKDAKSGTRGAADGAAVGQQTQTAAQGKHSASATDQGSQGETIHTTASHPWLTTDHGWLPAGFLRIGETVRQVDGSTATVVAVRIVPGAAYMWDLTVSQVHDFAVGTGAYVVHNVNCGKVDYGSTDLSSEIRDRRIKAHDITGNYAGALFDDGTTAFAKSGAKHAEEYLLEQADADGKSIVELYTEREPCANKCEGLLQRRGITNVSWSWDWNGLDHAQVSAEMRRYFRSLW